MTFDPVHMTEPEEYWVLRPVFEGMCSYEALVDGRLGLHDIARMNEALDIRAENQARFDDTQRDK